MEVFESVQRFHDYPIVKVVHVLRFLGRIVDRDPLHNGSEGFVMPDSAQHFPRQRHRLVASSFQQRLGGVTRGRVREAYFKVTKEVLQRNETMKARHQ